MESHISHSATPQQADGEFKIKLSDLAGVLWKTLEAGEQEVDRLHDEYFAERQVEHFTTTYQSVEAIAPAFRRYSPGAKSPMELFAKLGKPAQMIIIRDSLLEPAVENYERAQNLVRKEEETEAAERKQERIAQKQEETRRKAIRALDNEQCVFCGRLLTKHFKYIPLSAESTAPENVVLTCHSCEKDLAGRTPAAAGMVPLHGRFGIE